MGTGRQRQAPLIACARSQRSQHLAHMAGAGRTAICVRLLTPVLRFRYLRPFLQPPKPHAHCLATCKVHHCLPCVGIYGASATGEDMTRDCQDQKCNFLQPSQWMCFAVPLEWNKCALGPHLTQAHLRSHSVSCTAVCVSAAQEMW